MQTGLRGIAAPIGIGNLRYKPAGAGSRTRTAQGALRDAISVMDYIPERIQADIRTGLSGGTDLQPYIQKAVDHLETFTFDAFKGTGRPALRIPAGLYTTSTVTADKNMALVGDGKESTLIRLRSGVSTSLFALNAEQIAASTVDDTIHYVIKDMTLLGNRVDSTTTGTSHGVHCPDAPWSLATQYSPSVIMEDVEISGFTGNGIHLGSNRNWALLCNTNARYCNDNGLFSLSYDSRLKDCDFGSNKNYGARLAAGGANSFVGCNFYFNSISNILVNNFVNSPNWFTNCSVDYGGVDNVDISSPTAPTTFTACRFQGASRLTPNTDADIKVTGTAADLKVIGCDFIFSGQTPAYLVELNGATPDVVWEGNHISAALPYATAVCNNMAKLAVERMPGNVRRFINTLNANHVQVARFEGAWTTRADGDTAYISHMLADDSGAQSEFARMSWTGLDVNVGTGLDGKLLWSIMQAGVLTDYLGLQSNLLFPVTNDLISLGAGSVAFSDLFLASGGVINWNNGNATLTHSAGLLASNVPLKTAPYTVATLPAAATMGAGSRAFVTDANATTFASIVAAGGANGVPVYSDGANWRIG